jgi:hypothetical protein
MAKLGETLAELKDVQKDIRAILQMMTQRFALLVYQESRGDRFISSWMTLRN